MPFQYSESVQVVWSVLYYLLVNYIEVIAATTGFIYLIYSVAENKLLWFFGLVTSVLYVYICFIARIYADMGINLYYVVISIYGWIHWTTGKSKQSKELPVSKITLKNSMVLLGITLALFLIIAFVLVRFTDSEIAYWDAFTTAASITATWMLARKILEHWLIWIVVDAVSVGLYIFKGLYPTVILFTVYTALAVMGYYEWRKSWSTIRQNQSV